MRTVEEVQRDATNLVAEIPQIDFQDLPRVLDWIVGLIDPSQYDVDFDTQAVISALEQHGYRAGENTGDEFNESDRENYARWIIGQALSNLKDEEISFIPNVVSSWVGQWHQDFN